MTNELLSCLKTRVARRFVLVFLLMSLLPLLLMRWLAIRESEAAIKEQTFTVLRAASDGAEAELREFIEMLEEDLVQLTHDPRLAQVLKSNLSSDESSGILASQKPSDVEEVFVLNDEGNVLCSTSVKKVGLHQSETEHFARGWEGFHAGDVLNDPVTGNPTWIMTAPVRDGLSHRTLGVLGFRIDPRKLSELTSGRRTLLKGANSQSFRLGETGETYLVNEEGLLITESRYVTNAVLRLKAQTLPVKVGLERGQEIAGLYQDYRGTEVSGRSVILKKPPWILVTEIDFSQAFAPIRQLRKQMIVATAGLILLSILFASACTWRVLNPIRLLNESDHALAERNEAKAFVPETGLPNDEIGDLVRTRNSRVRAVFDYQKQLEQRTVKLQEMISELEHISYAIVHDMRAPLRAMQGFASLIEAEGDTQSPEERRRYLRTIKSAAERLDQLIRDVLTYNKTVLRHVSLHPVELSSLLRGILETYPNLNDGSAEITVQGILPTVMGNEALLTQCFANLLDNAVKFVAPAKKARVRIWAEEVAGSVAGAGAVVPMLVTNGDDGRKSKACVPQFARIWVEDNGVGIPNEAQGKIFAVFQRLTHEQHGTGVGLAIVRKVVERMGGRVGVESQPGEGSRFWVELQSCLPEETDVECALRFDPEAEPNLGAVS